jgi:hypothetical protein
MLMSYFYLTKPENRDQIFIVTNENFCDELTGHGKFENSSIDYESVSQILNITCKTKEFLKHKMIIVPIYGLRHFAIVVIVNPDIIYKVE